MGSYDWQEVTRRNPHKKSNEDLTKEISYSVYVTNFPDSISSRDLWIACKVYGTVVDVFIPLKKSKAGKRFAFVRFIKVFNLDRLVQNLCTIWIGSHHLFANRVRFERSSKYDIPGNSHRHKESTNDHSFASSKPYSNGKTSDYQKPNHVPRFGQSQEQVGSYVNAVHGVSDKVNSVLPNSSTPAMVLDDDCIIERDYSKCVKGRVKDVGTISRLRIILQDEGFVDVQVFYLGGLWVMLEFVSMTSKEKLLKHTGVNSWFHGFQEVNQDFVSNERIIWVDIEGIPLNAWTRNTFARIGKKWGEMLNMEDSCDSSFNRKRVCIRTNHPTSILESFKVIIKGKVAMVRAKELFMWTPAFVDPKETVDSSDDESVNEGRNNVQHPLFSDDEGDVNGGSDVDEVADTVFDGSEAGKNGLNDKTNNVSEDPFGVYDLLNKNKSSSELNGSSPSLTHPPGFTPVGSETPEAIVHASGDANVGMDNKESSPQISANIMNEPNASCEEIFNESVGNSKGMNGGSVLGVLEEVICVGQAMGYDMNGCAKDIEEIIQKQGDDTVFK